MCGQRAGQRIAGFHPNLTCSWPKKIKKKKKEEKEKKRKTSFSESANRYAVELVKLKLLRSELY